MGNGTDHDLRRARRSGARGFTLIELLLVIAIISILGSTVMAAITSARQKAYTSKALMELRQMEKALDFYYEKYADYPPEVDRNVPPGIEEFLTSSNLGSSWPHAPWPGSVYDWDNWDDPDTPGAKIYQISIRFCPDGGPISACAFPRTEWAEDFDVDSAVYYCVSGACRSDISQPVDYPGYCPNCSTP